ncbi:hypothetical protein F5Y14DRAFT_457314 [Nemania sp. NC0429]|nr:hypothetical protein F5Y14DRAFT_457314 [Nemania sp. NC0429]
MAPYEDGYPSRGRGAEYYTYSGGAASAPSYPHIASPGRSTYNGKPQARITYDPQGDYIPPPPPSTGLHVTESRSRPRSLGPPIEPSDGVKERGANKYGESDDSDDGRTWSPIGKAKKFVDSTFTDSAVGLGVGVLGALAGGLAAREAVGYMSKHQRSGEHRRRDEAEHRRNQLIGTVVGAAVGALGANAVEKRIEARRAGDEAEENRWERKWRRPSGDEGEVLEKLEVVARPRSRGYSRGSRRDEDWDDAWNDGDRDGGRGGRSRSRSRRGVEREVDTGARSWKDVEDWRMATR